MLSKLVVVKMWRALGGNLTRISSQMWSKFTTIELNPIWKPTFVQHLIHVVKNINFCFLNFWVVDQFSTLLNGYDQAKLGANLLFSIFNTNIVKIVSSKFIVQKLLAKIVWNHQYKANIVFECHACCCPSANKLQKIDFPKQLTALM